MARRRARRILGVCPRSAERAPLPEQPGVSESPGARRPEPSVTGQTDRKDPVMSTIHRSRNLVVGIATVVAVTLLAPLAVTAEEEVADLAPVAAPAVVGTSVDDVGVTRVLAAQSALHSGDLGSLQEEALFAIVAAAPSWDATSGSGAVEVRRVRAAH